MNEDKIESLKALQENLGYLFQDETLLENALTHRSFANEYACPPGKDNERLEFLGDAVLDLCVSDLLMYYFPDDSEGNLSKRRAACVNERTLAEIARRFHLGEYLLLGKGEELSGGRLKPSLLANAFEAVVAAVYIDGGFERASAFIRRLFADLVKEGLEDILYKDYKTLLQEACQNRFRETPRYSVIQESGPDHDKTFDVRLEVSDHVTTTGTGKSRKEAEQEAAKRALDSFDVIRDKEGSS
ncbi:MAG: ribonuclease III [Syntrophales bacterium]|nr:ribonuclease III [Syntrophales bacterium]